jgi:hypothetical protein
MASPVFELPMAQVDGVYPATQIHLRAKKQFSDWQQDMIHLAALMPGSGMVSIDFVANIRVILTVTLPPSLAQRHARLACNVVNQVVAGEWLCESPVEIKGIPRIGFPYNQLDPVSQGEIKQQYEDQYPFSDNVDSWLWWRATVANVDSVRKSLKAREELRVK